MKYQGHVPELPIKRGDTVTIVKGVTIRHRGEKITAKRTYKVVVSHILNGVTNSEHDRAYNSRHGRETIDTNPTIVFAGRGGYWSEVDINDIPEAQ